MEYCIFQPSECGELPETSSAFGADVRRGAFLAVLAAFPAHGGVCWRTVTQGLNFNGSSSANQHVL